MLPSGTVRAGLLMGAAASDVMYDAKNAEDKMKKK
jgi:hypothetical protein